MLFWAFGVQQTWGRWNNKNCDRILNYSSISSKCRHRDHLKYAIYQSEIEEKQVDLDFYQFVFNLKSRNIFTKNWPNLDLPRSIWPKNVEVNLNFHQLSPTGIRNTTSLLLPRDWDHSVRFLYKNFLTCEFKTSLGKLFNRGPSLEARL